VMEKGYDDAKMFSEWVKSSFKKLME
jgi:hypothetical protein